MPSDTKPDYLVLIDRKTCPQAELHDPEVEAGIPPDFTSFSQWAVAKAETHRPAKCPGCGLYKIWVPL